MKQKVTIGKIPYSIGLRSVNPGNTDSAKKVYAYAQRNETVGTRALAEHIHSHNSVYSVGTISGLIYDLVAEVQEQLLEGNRCSLDGLGSFYLSLKSTGADKPEDFTANNITKAVVRVDIDDQFQAAVDAKADFELVSSRLASAQAVKEEKEALNTELGVSDDDSTSGSGGGGNTGGTGDIEE